MPESQGESLSDESQAERAAFGTDVSEIRHEPQTSRLRLRAYVICVGLFPFALVAITLFAFTTGFYARHSGSPYLQQVGYARTLHDSGCQVVIEGDSTAMVSIEPAIIEQRTELKACNIAEIAGVQRVNGMVSLDTYLAQNQRPKYLLFLYAPNNLVPPAKWTDVASFEGYYYQLRFLPLASRLKQFTHDPDSVIQTAELGFRLAVQALFRPAEKGDPMADRVAAQGRVPWIGPALTSCANFPATGRIPDPRWVQNLRQTYNRDGTHVFVDATPMPSCDPALAFYAPYLTKPLVDDGQRTLPITAYSSTGNLHVNDTGAQMLSTLIADQIARAERGEP